MNELIDGYEASAVPDNIRAQRIESAGYSVGYKKESDAVKALEKGTVSSDTEATDETNAYKKIIREVKNMKKRGMKVSEMRIAINADVEEALLIDEKFANTSSTIGAELVREGVIGKIGGVPVKPNYLMSEDIEFVIYDKRFCQKYTVWKKEPVIEDIKDDKHIGASHLVGRQVGGIMVTNKLGVQIKKKSSVIVEPEISSITVTPESELVEPISVGTKVATLSADGGTPDYTYSLAGGTDDNKFKIENNEVQAKEEINNGTYTIKVKVTDSKLKEKISEDITITVKAKPDPEITEVTVNMTKQTSTKTEATKGQEIGSVSVTGGTEPYTYTIEGTDADSFEMNSTTIQLKENLTEEKEYKATVKVTDSKQKTKTSDEFTFTVSGE